MTLSIHSQTTKHTHNNNNNNNKEYEIVERIEEDKNGAHSNAKRMLIKCKYHHIHAIDTSGKKK